VAIDGYIKVSDVGGREGERYAAPSQQRKAIEEAAQRISEPLGEVVIEEDVSGAKRAEDRGLGYLLDRCERGESSGIIVSNIDRLSRGSLKESAEIYERLDKAGAAPSADHLRGLQAEVGAMLTGRRTFERADGWGGQHPWDVPAFVATHHVPDGWPRPGSTVQFVTDGIESAVARAKSAAGPKSVGVHGAQTIQQCLDAGLLDEIHIDLAAVLLGAGVRLFDHLANTPVVLGNPTVVTGVGVTHLRYPVHTS